MEEMVDITEDELLVKKIAYCNGILEVEKSMEIVLRGYAKK
ncbi:hypothetical protein [Lysinibacillus sp. FJAT-14745]|nr:hypothetical protein [Lysinibacillus sp. FJAT-14745]